MQPTMSTITHQGNFFLGTIYKTSFICLTRAVFRFEDEDTLR